MRILVSSLAVIPALLIVFAACEPRRGRAVSRSEILMGTEIAITAGGCGEEALNKAFDAIRSVEAVMSRFHESSELSRLNRSAGTGPVVVSAELYEIIRLSLDVSENTNGAFDISIQPAIELWSSKCCKPPTNFDLDAIKPLVDYRKIEIIPPDKVLLPAGMSINLDAVAKGYASDIALETLAEAGCSQAIVNSGGDSVCFSRGKAAPWRIAIEGLEAQGPSMTIKNGAVATSGVGRRWMVIGEQKFAHVVDPRSLEPVSGAMTTASALARTGAPADAWATAALVAGERIFDEADMAGVGIALETAGKRWIFNETWKRAQSSGFDTERQTRPTR